MPTIAEAIAEAWQRHQAGHLREAEERYRGILRDAPTHPTAWYLLGIACQVQGKLDQAIASYRQALCSRPDFPEVLTNLGITYASTGRPADAIRCYRRAAQINPNFSRAHNNLGLALAEQGSLTEAVAAFREALRLEPELSEAHYNLGNALQHQGLLEEAIACYRRALELHPECVEANNNLGLVLRNQGRLEEAIPCLRTAVWLQPDSAEAQYNLAAALQEHGCLDEANVCFRRAFELRPDLGVDSSAGAVSDGAGAAGARAATLIGQGKLHEAEACLRQWLALTPRDADAHFRLGNVLSARGRLDDAIACFRRGLELCPESVDGYNGLAIALTSRGHLDDAAACLQTALTLAPERADLRSNLGGVRREQGLLADALRCFEQASQWSPGSETSLSNLLVCRNYDPSADSSALLAEHRLWADLHAPRVSPLPYSNTRDPERRLRIGYSSPDFCRHPVASFLEPIIAQHDPREFEVYCYAEGQDSDSVTARFQARAHAWRRTTGFTDGQVAEQIRSDGIDLLTDLAGHTANNRLGVFALKPAPVQITYLGYPNTTGMTMVDYRLTDAIADPPDEPLCHTEELVRLPRAFCYKPPDYFPDVTSLPALGSGGITFGSMHHLIKLNGRVLDLWCDLLKALPSARLLMVRHTLRDSVRDRFHKELTRRGIGRERFELRAIERNMSYLENYGAIDIALDAFPWSGHTTACESLWMGVPVMTLFGERCAGRMAASALTSLSLTEWVADSPEKFIEIGIRAACDLERLARLRADLRARMAASPLCDAKSFTRSLEQTYRDLWRRWCDQRSRQPF
jgi:protein O-GlcNAc transferase